VGKTCRSAQRVNENLITLFAPYGRLKENPPPGLADDKEFQKFLDYWIINAEESMQTCGGLFLHV